MCLAPQYNPDGTRVQFNPDGTPVSTAPDPHRAPNGQLYGTPGAPLPSAPINPLNAGSKNSAPGTYEYSGPKGSGTIAGNRLVRTEQLSDGSYRYHYISPAGEQFSRYTPLGHASAPTGGGAVADQVYSPTPIRNQRVSDLGSLRIPTSVPSAPAAPQLRIGTGVNHGPNVNRESTKSK